MVIDAVDIALDQDKPVAGFNFADTNISTKSFRIFVHALKETANAGFKNMGLNFEENLVITNLSFATLQLSDELLAYLSTIFYFQFLCPFFF